MIIFWCKKKKFKYISHTVTKLYIHSAAAVTPGLNGQTQFVFEIPPAELVVKKNWMRSTVLTCNVIKHSGCFRTTAVSPPTPQLHSHHTTEICRQHSPGQRCWSVDRMNDFLQLQPDTLSVCISESETSELSSLPKHITSNGGSRRWMEDTHIHTLMYACIQNEHRCTHKLHTRDATSNYLTFFPSLIIIFIMP